MAYLDDPWFWITSIVDPRIWTAIAVILFLVRMKYSKAGKDNLKWVGKFIIISVFSAMIAFGASQIIKEVVKIPRPCAVGVNPYCEADPSFPSGHASIAFAAFTGIYVILDKKKYLWVYIFPVLVSLSRIAMGVHTVYDIIGGAVLGIAVTLIFAWLTRKNNYLGKWVGK